MKQTFPGVPILGLTATATSRVVKDVQKILNIQGCLVLKASFNRPNLYYEVLNTAHPFIGSYKIYDIKWAEMLKIFFFTLQVSIQYLATNKNFY